MNDRQAPAGYTPAGSTDDAAQSPYGYGYPQETGYTHHHGGGTAEEIGGGAPGYGSDPYGQATAYDHGHHAATGWDNTPAHGMPRFQDFAERSEAGHDTGQGAAWSDGSGTTAGYDTGATGSDGWGGDASATSASYGNGYGNGWDGYAAGGYAGADSADHGGGWENGWSGTTEAPAVQPTPGEWDARGSDSEGWGTGGGWDAGAEAPREAGGYDSTGHESGYDDPYGVTTAPAGEHRETDGDRWDGDGTTEGETAHAGTGTDTGYAEYPERVPGDEPDDAPGPDTMAFRAITHHLAAEGTDPGDRTGRFEPSGSEDHHDPSSVDADRRSGFGDDDPEGPVAPRRGRRRSPKPRRSALLTVAAPSLCVLGVTAVATASVTGNDSPGEAGEDIALGGEDTDDEAAEAVRAAHAVANKQFDTQLQGLTAAADDYSERVSRTQGRIDLEERKAEEKRLAEEEIKRKEEEAKRLEELRPKFFLPVERRGLSAVYGQSGLNWANLHTGIDFPVRYGTPVRAATDGTIRTQYHVSYGNLMIITAPDGTETWYAHLGSYVYQSGYVQAGTVVAHSGNSGNSMGPHLHFEVRPGGGSAVDPSAWLRSKGLEPS